MNLDVWDLYSTMIPLETQDFLTHLDEWVEDLHRSLILGRNVLVHCRMGISRSVALGIAYLIKHFGMSFKEARQYVASRSPKIKPNHGFVEDLLKFEMICCARDQKKNSITQRHTYLELCVQEQAREECRAQQEKKRLAH